MRRMTFNMKAVREKLFTYPPHEHAEIIRRALVRREITPKEAEELKASLA